MAPPRQSVGEAPSRLAVKPLERAQFVGRSSEDILHCGNPAAQRIRRCEPQNCVPYHHAGAVAKPGEKQRGQRQREIARQREDDDAEPKRSDDGMQGDSRTARRQKARRRQGRDKRAGGACRPQQAEALGTYMQYIVGKDREQRIGAREKHCKQIKRHRAQQNLVAKDIAHAFDDPPPCAVVAASGQRRPIPNAKQYPRRR